MWKVMKSDYWRMIIYLQSQRGLLPPDLMPNHSPLPRGVVGVGGGGGGGGDGEGGGVVVEGDVGDAVAQGKWSLCGGTGVEAGGLLVLVVVLVVQSRLLQPARGTLAALHFGEAVVLLQARGC